MCKTLYMLLFHSKFNEVCPQIDPLLGFEEYFNKFPKSEIMQAGFSGNNTIMLF